MLLVVIEMDDGFLIRIAVLAYRACGDGDRVSFLERIVQLEEVPMLQGYLKVFLGQKQVR